MKYSLSIPIFLIILFSSFSNHEPAAVKIKISSPENDFKFSKGDTIRIKAKAETEGEIHNLKLSISPEGLPSIFDDVLHTHQRTVNYSKDYVCNLKLKTRLKIKLESLDHGGKVTGVDSVWVKLR